MLAQVCFVINNAGVGILQGSLIQTLLTLDVLVAELDGSPIPPDYFASHGDPLHPVQRDGRRIGWYSVGNNGHDDGGKQVEDYGIATDGSFGRPFFADPPKPRALPSPGGMIYPGGPGPYGGPPFMPPPSSRPSGSP